MRIGIRSCVGRCGWRAKATAIAVGLLIALSRPAGAATGLLADAAERQDRAAVRALLQQHVDVNGPQGDGTTALHWAARWDDLETARLLIQAGADVNRKT